MGRAEHLLVTTWMKRMGINFLLVNSKQVVMNINLLSGRYMSSY